MIKDKTCEGQVIILSQLFLVTITYDLDCDKHIGLLHVDMTINNDMTTDIAQTWLMNQDMIEQCEDIVWLAENPARDYGS